MSRVFLTTAGTVVTGPTGPAGPVGPPGPPGAGSWRGTWSNATAYDLQDEVQGSDGLYYLAVQANTGHDPTTDSTHTYWLPTLPALAVTASATDALGRTQVMQTSSIKAPALRQFVSVDDAPWSAAGNAKRVTDGAIASGSNQLSSTSAAFTSADVGKIAEVVGAGSGAGFVHNISGYIGAVVAGVASLYTTAAFSTPKNAGATVTNAIVTFGTDDTAAVQSAANAVSNAGGGVLNFSQSKAYWFANHIPASNVTYKGNLATFYVLPLPAATTGNQAFVLSPITSGQAAHQTTVSGAGQTISTTPSTLTVVSTSGFPTSGYLAINGVNGAVAYTGISGSSFTGCTILQGSYSAPNGNVVGNLGTYNVTLREMNWVGHGQDMVHTYPLSVVGCVDWRVYDCFLSNYPPNGLYFYDASGTRIVNNKFTNVCSALPYGDTSVGNPINFQNLRYSDVFPNTDNYVAGNRITGCISECIDFGLVATPTGFPQIQSVGFRFVVTGNHTQNTQGSGGMGVWCENGGADPISAPVHAIVITNNVCIGGGIVVNQDGSAGDPADQSRVAKIVVQGNVVDMAGENAHAIQVAASDAAVVGNVVSACNGIWVSDISTGLSVTFGTVVVTGVLTNGSNLVTNVTGSQTFAALGSQTTAVGLTTGTFLKQYLTTTVSGAGQTISTTPSTLNVVSTANFPATGTLTVVGVTGTVTYTGVAGNSFTGCTIASGSFTATNAGAVSSPTTWVLSANATAGDGTTPISVTAIPLASNNVVSSNTVHLVAGATGSLFGIYLIRVRESSVLSNSVTMDAAVAYAPGLELSNCGWIRVRGNSFDNCTGQGIYVQYCNDLTIQENVIYNPSVIASSFVAGMRLLGTTGTANLVQANYIVDDRPVRQMGFGIEVFVTTWPCTNVLVRDNTIIGSSLNWISSLSGVISLRGNHTDQAHSSSTLAISAITPGASPYTYTNSDPFPEQVLISGGTVSSIQLSRNNGSTFFTVGGTGGAVYLMTNDQLKVTYSAAPTMDKVPMW